MSFDGDDDSVDIPHSSLWSFGTGDFTIEVWYKPDDLTNSCNFVAQYDLDGGDVTLQRFSKATNAGENKLNMYFLNNDVVVGNYTMTNAWSVGTGKWYHLVFQRSGISGLIYIDGISQDLTETVAFGSNDLGDSSSVLRISADWYVGGGQLLDGFIDDFRIYNYARTPEQILQDYNGGVATYFK